MTGILPTTVLGRVQSPDLDDWSEKVYRFEGKPSRYFDLTQGGNLTCKSGVMEGEMGKYKLGRWVLRAFEGEQGDQIVG